MIGGRSERVHLLVMTLGYSRRIMQSRVCLAGIGFTMSLFITGLVFPQGPLLPAAKVGIPAASTIAGTIGWHGYEAH